MNRIGDSFTLGASVNILRTLAFLGLLAIGAFFSVIAVAVLLTVGASLWGYVLWKTRHIRRAMRAQTANAGVKSGGSARYSPTNDSSVVLEGEYEVVSKSATPLR